VINENVFVPPGVLRQGNLQVIFLCAESGTRSGRAAQEAEKVGMVGNFSAPG
jgi:hypothetical protein